MAKSNPLNLKTNFRTTGWWIFVILSGILAFVYFTGIPTVPFHPDESTQLFMSNDFDLLLQAPLSMTYSPERQNDVQQNYRELDAPLTKYILGLGRSIAGLQALPVDWDWGKTWQQNVSTGAVPSNELLFAGRLSLALLFPLSLFFLFQTGKQMNGALTGVLAVLLLATNSLILLHTRRAMAEGALIFTVCFALWSFTQGYRYPWLAGLGMALALNAKQSTLALIPVGLFAVLYPIRLQNKPVSHWAKAFLQYAGMIALVTLVLNPLFWNEPFSAAKDSWNARQNLLQRQVEDATRLMPEIILKTPGQRSAVMVVNLYIGPPMFAEVGNYREYTAPIEQVYLENPFNTLLRTPIGAGILLFLTIFGISVALLQIIQRKTTQHRILLLMMLSTIAQVLALLWAVPLPWQRYSLPVVPFVCIWSAFGITQLVRATRKTLSKNTT